MLLFASLGPFSVCGAMADDLQRVVASFQRLRDVFDERPELDDLSSKRPLLDVGKQSEDSTPIIQLKDENIAIYKGEKVLLRGSNGAGKSTLLRLLVGLVHQDRRSAQVLDQEIQLWPMEELRRRIAYLPQSTVLFEGTIAENIAFGAIEPDVARVAEVCDLTGAWSVIKRFKNGLNHKLYEGGVGLSGGEKQIIALARTLYADPDILLLDEPTSALDSERRQNFHALLSRIWGDKTVILTTHDAVNEDAFDRIIDLDSLPFPHAVPR
jgi:ATP-binding cassette subfamily B protein